MENNFKRDFLQMLVYYTRMDNLNRRALGLLYEMKPHLPYDSYIRAFDAIHSVESSIYRAFLEIKDVKEDICDTQQ